MQFASFAVNIGNQPRRFDTLRHWKTSTLGFTEGQYDRVMQAAISEVSTRGNVVPRPNRVGVKRKQPLCPVSITADGALVLELVGREEDSMMRNRGRRRIQAIQRREDDISDSGQFGLLDKPTLKAFLQAVPIAVVNCYSCPVPIEDGVNPKRQTHDELQEFTAVHAVCADGVHYRRKLIAHPRPILGGDRVDEVQWQLLNTDRCP